jgi:hypothetical protein
MERWNGTIIGPGHVSAFDCDWDWARMGQETGRRERRRRIVLARDAVGGVLRWEV